MAYDPVSGLIIHGGNQYNTYGYHSGTHGYGHHYDAPYGSSYNPIGQHLNSPYYAAAHPQAGFNALGLTLGGAVDATNLYNQQLYGPGGAFEQAFGSLEALPGVAQQAGQMGIDAAAQAGQAATGVADAQYQQMVGMGQDLQADVSGRVDQSIKRAQQAFDDYDADSYASIAAAAGAISEQTTQQLMQMDGLMGAEMPPGALAQMKQDARIQGMKNLQSTIAPMQQQQQQVKAQLGVNVANMMQSGAGLISNTGLGVMGQVNASAQQRNSAYQFAGSLSTNAAMQAGQMQVSAAQAQMQGFQSLAGAIAAAPPQFVNYFDTFMQGQFLYDHGIVGYNTPLDVTGGFYGMFA